MSKLQFASRDVSEPTWRPSFVLPVECVTDFDYNEDRQRHCLWMRIVEDLTVETREHPRLGRTLHVMCLTDPRNYSYFIVSMTRQMTPPFILSHKSPRLGQISLGCSAILPAVRLICVAYCVNTQNATVLATVSSRRVKSRLKLEKLSSFENRGPRRATVTTPTQTQVQRSVCSKDRVETDGRTDGQKDGSYRFIYIPG